MLDKINQKHLLYIAEVNKLRINNEVPGVKIPIYDEQKLFENQPDYALILSWNMYNGIVKTLKKNGYLNKFIRFHPYVKIEN